MSKITIVTAFFDIGRGDWTPDNGLPHYLQRTNATYMERFSRMAKLDNDMIIYTSEDLAQEISTYREGKPNTKIVIVDIKEQFKDLRERISAIQNNDEYKRLINTNQIKNPEYWNADYVLVNFLKSHFATHAIKNDLVDSELVAWMDFGYCRDDNTTNGLLEWKYNFDQTKIHVFSIKYWIDGTYISDVIANNDVHITGPHIIASKEMWPKLEHMMNTHMEFLVNNNLVDDDQTLLLMCVLSNPDRFSVHVIQQDDWFVMFKDYNDITA